MKGRNDKNDLPSLFLPGILLSSEARGKKYVPPMKNEITKKGTSHFMSIIPESYLDLLQSTALVYVATIGPKGEPQVSPLLFDWDGTHILLGTNKASQKYRNLLREPRIALSLVDPGNPYRALEIRGKVVRIDEDPDTYFANALIRKYLNRDRNADEAQPGEERVIIFVEPERVLPFPRTTSNVR
jgi:PPOX class probable F420-dependent enzyme